MKRHLALIALILVGSALAPTPASAQHERGATPRTTAVRAPRAGAPRPKPTVRPVVHQEYYDQGAAVGGEYIVDDIHGDMLSGGCGSCGSGGCSGSVGGGAVGALCNSCNSPARFCICFPSHGWVNAEYLLWYQDGMRVPALATSSPTGTARANAGVLGQPGSVLYGDDDILDEESSGFRIRFGWWLSSFPGWGVEGEYVGLEQQTESFFQESNGSPIIARPFYNVLIGAEDAQLVAFPNVTRGSLSVDATNRLDGAAVRFRKQLSSAEGCGYSNLTCTTVPTSSRLDATLGYRFWQLSESLHVREQSTSLLTGDPGSFDINDRFETRNLFNGAELGVLWQGRRGCWSLDGLMRLAVGNVHQTITVNGTSVITEGANPGVSTTYPTGFLVQNTNNGTFTRNRFTMVPELGLTAGYQMTKRLRLTTGYSLIYWGNVVRPGEQIDPAIHTNLLAPQQTAVALPNRPQFQFDGTDYWVQGLSFGGEFRW